MNEHDRPPTKRKVCDALVVYLAGVDQEQTSSYLFTHGKTTIQRVTKACQVCARSRRKVRKISLGLCVPLIM